LIPSRDKLHKIIDKLPEEVLINALYALNNIEKNKELISRINSLPIYDISNPTHIKTLLKESSSRINKNPSASFLRTHT
jgi:hypothetical protein